MRASVWMRFSGVRACLGPIYALLNLWLDLAHPEENHNPQLQEEAKHTPCDHQIEDKDKFHCCKARDESNQHGGNEKAKSPFCRVKKFTPVIVHIILFYGVDCKG